TYIDAEVYVPATSLESYKNNNGWGNFYKILPIDDSGVGEISPDDTFISVSGNTLNVKSDYPVEIFSMDGRLLHNSKIESIVLPDGLYIVRINGKTRKIHI
ncbi:MAG: T9SS type A sorting domain-containing protein, partial [Muribaculaceae bacterium]|nr:T9SS type A sorting domain-containing protein [Muribaculaceae bacterium]